jgi:hypothetical protein
MSKGRVRPSSQPPGRLQGATLHPPSLHAESSSKSEDTLTTYLSSHLPTYLPYHLPSYLISSPPTFPPTYLPTYLSTHLPTYLPSHLPTLLPTYLGPERETGWWRSEGKDR